MSTFGMTLTVEMADGRKHEVIGDQRDWAQMEVLDLPGSAVVSRTRAIAWAALKRAGLYNGRWERFSEHDCVRVTEVSVDDDEQAGTALDEQAGDPPPAGEPDPKVPAGPKVRGGASTSSSPARRAARSRK